MSTLSMFRRRKRHISRALIRRHLEDSDFDDYAEDDTTSLSLLLHDTAILRCTSAENLSSCISWLSQLCEQEQTQLEEVLENDSGRPAGLSNAFPFQPSKRQDSRHDRSTVCLSLNTGVLRHICQGRGPRDKVPDDLLAVFRGKDTQIHGAETYGAMKKTLLSWNERMAQTLEDDRGAREVLKTAIKRRADLLKGFTHGSDKTQALVKSSSELLQALTALRPEIAHFRDQEFFNILLVMWANVRVAMPDLDDELKLLTVRALMNELQSKSHISNAEKLSGMARSLSVARLMLDFAGIKRLEAKVHFFEQKMRQTIVKKLIQKIKSSRKELMQVKLKELQTLTVLQVAQKLAAHAKLSTGQYMQDQSRACDQVDGRLQGVLQQQVPELDAHVQIVENKANALANMSVSLLSRAMKAGIAMEDEHSSTLVELAQADLKAYVGVTVADMLCAREEAAKMLDRMDTVESHLDVLLDAASSQYRAYDEILGLLVQAGSLSTSDSTNIELAEKYGPRRESILPMIRNTQRAKHG